MSPCTSSIGTRCGCVENGTTISPPSSATYSRAPIQARAPGCASAVASRIVMTWPAAPIRTTWRRRPDAHDRAARHAVADQIDDVGAGRRAHRQLEVAADAADRRLGEAQHELVARGEAVEIEIGVDLALVVLEVRDRVDAEHLDDELGDVLDVGVELHRRAGREARRVVRAPREVDALAHRGRARRAEHAGRALAVAGSRRTAPRSRARASSHARSSHGAIASAPSGSRCTRSRTSASSSPAGGSAGRVAKVGAELRPVSARATFADPLARGAAPGARQRDQVRREPLGGRPCRGGARRRAGATARAP